MYYYLLFIIYFIIIFSLIIMTIKNNIYTVLDTYMFHPYYKLLYLSPPFIKVLLSNFYRYFLILFSPIGKSIDIIMNVLFAESFYLFKQYHI